MVHKPDVTIDIISPPPFNDVETIKHRQADGYVEAGRQDGTWEPLLKIGARPGDGWERNGRSYTLKEFTRHGGFTCAVVLEQWIHQGMKHERLSWYAKGEGPVKREDRAEWQGKMKLLALTTIEGNVSEESKSKYDWGAKAPEEAKQSADPVENGGGQPSGSKGGKSYTVKVEGRTVRIELSEAMAEEIDLSDLVYNKRDWRIDLKVKMLKSFARRFTKWRYTVYDKAGVALSSSELIHPSLSVGQTGESYLYLGPENKNKVVKITLP